VTDEPAGSTGLPGAPDQLSLAADVVCLLRERGETLATAESLTGGLVVAALTAVAGSSAVVRGGIVAYASEVKRDVLTVDADLLGRHGAVSREVAVEMATRVADLFASSWAISTTGVAGPERQDGQPVGTVYVSVAGPRHVWSTGSSGLPVSNLDDVAASAELGTGTGAEVMQLALTGSRAQIRASTVVHSLQVLRDRICSVPRRI